MNVKTLVLSILSLFTLTSHALHISSARIDAKRKVLVLNVRTDCNLYSPVLRYDFSAKRSDGPHYYSLNFTSTKMHCNSRRWYIRQIEMPLPQQYAYQTVSIRYGDVFLQYTTSDQLKDQDVEVILPSPPALDTSAATQ